MREQLEALIRQHGYQVVLNDLSLLMARSITPLVIRYDIVWTASKDLNQLAFKLGRVKKGEAT